MAEQTYYFNAYVTPVWVNPNNLVDGNIGTFAASGAKKSTVQVLTGNTCPGDDLGIISKVELRVFAYGDGDDRIDITPVFTGGDGDVHETVPVVSPGDWTAYVDITSDTNHPDWSAWSQVQSLGCIIDNVAVAKANVMYASKVEVRVTYWVPPVSDIDVGAAPIDRPSWVAQGYTRINKDNPANASGRLHSIKIWAFQTDLRGLIVGTFYITNGNTLKCRDSALIGDVIAGSEQTFAGLSIAIEEGDYIGAYWPGGSLEASYSGFDGIWWLSDNYANPGDEAIYDLNAGRAMSLYGYGDIEEVVVPTVTTQAVTDIGTTTATGNGNITATGGQNCSKRGVCWNTTGNPTVADDKSEETDSFGTGAFERPMTGLSPSQHYYVRAYAYNSEGYGYGDQVEFDTLAMTSPTTTTQAVTAILGTTATGNGSITDTGGENPSKRGVCWNTTGSPTVADDKSEETDSFGVGAFSRPMTGLVIDTHYYVRAYAYNSQGYGYGNEVEFDAAPPGIDIGAPAIERELYTTPDFTRISKTNPANASGMLHTIEVYAFLNMTGLRVGTFYATNGSTFKCRDSVLIGDVEAGAVRTFTGLSIAVEAGDYIGCFSPSGGIQSGVGEGWWYVTGEFIDPDDETAYTFYGDRALSLYGYGDLPVGWTGKISGVTNPAKIMGVDVANIAKVKGVASA
ncbi:hypothetical protein ES703_06389 [subsurface metagenome]